MFRNTALASAALALTVSAACLGGDEDFMTIGSKAPAIDIEHWVKGKEIQKLEEGKVYVLEFWATWCGPCIMAMPHLSELQAEYKDYGVTFIGVSDEPLELVEEFLTQTNKADGKLQNDRIRYTLTTDPDKSVYKDYFKAAGQNGIPCSFIIGKTGEIEFIGHPMTMDEALENVVRDTWDREAFKKTYEEGMKISRLQSRIYKAMNEEEWDKAIEICDKILQLEPENINIQFTKIMILLNNKKDYEAGYAQAAIMVKQQWDDANMLNTIAWNIVDTEGFEVRDLDLAMKATTRSNELSDFESAAYLDTLARVCFDQGNIENAIKWQEKAVEFADDDPMGEGIRESLEKYRKAAK